MEGLRSAMAARQPVEEDARASLRHIESVIAGSSTRGAAGENILEEALRPLPPEMLQRNVWVGGNDDGIPATAQLKLLNSFNTLRSLGMNPYEQAAASRAFKNQRADYLEANQQAIWVPTASGLRS